jgi:hypothetical protein
VTATTLPPQELEQWRDCLTEFASVRLPQGKNIPNRHTLQFVLFTVNDGLEHTKTWPIPQEMLRLLERMFPGNLDHQKAALIEAMRQTALTLRGTNLDRRRSPRGPTAMECLEAACIARLGYEPKDAEEAIRWQRIRDCRREWLCGTIDVWTGAMQDVEASPWRGLFKKARVETRRKLLVAACETVMDVWIENLNEELKGQEPPAKPPTPRHRLHRPRRLPRSPNPGGSLG